MFYYKKAAMLCALVMGISFCTACSDSKTDSKSDSSSKSEKDVTDSDSKVEIYLDSEGAAYYYDADGNKMILYSYPEEDYADSEYDETEYYVYDHYDSNGLVFDIPDGWFADNTYGSPILFMDEVDGEIDYDDSISFVPTNTVLDSDVTEVKEDTIKQYFDDLLSYGYYNSYEITDSGSMTVAGNDANYFDITVSYSLDEEDISFRSRYIFTKGEASYCVSITSVDSDEAFDNMIDIYEQIEKTLTLPTEEQMLQESDDEELIEGAVG